MSARSRLTRGDKARIRCEVMLPRIERIVERTLMVARAAMRRGRGGEATEAGRRADAHARQALDGARRALEARDVRGVRAAREDAREAERTAVAALRRAAEG